MNPKERGQKFFECLLEGKDGKALKHLKEGVDFSVVNKGDNPIHLAARLGRLDMIKHMLSAGADLHQENLHGNTAMHYAAREGHIELIQYLNDNGVDVNPRNHEGESPLYIAVRQQTMDVIETLVDLGMDPNLQDKNGNTPLHEALMVGAQEAMEGLLIKGAHPGIKNKKDEIAEDVANDKKNPYIRQSLQMYSSLLIAMKRGSVKAKGQKIVRKQVDKPLAIDRVGVIIAKIDIPSNFPTGFYCRREKAENSTVGLPECQDETIFSDVFFLRIFEVNRNCKAHLQLPIYKAPSGKEELVLRFIDCQNNEITVVKDAVVNESVYCPLDVVLVPETNCICVVYVRPRTENRSVGKKSVKIRSDMDKDFAMEIPAGTFTEETTLSLRVFDSDGKSGESQEADDLEDDDFDEAGTDIDMGATATADSNEGTESNDDGHSDNTTMQQITDTADILTDVYQITVTGKQPQKDIKVTIPLSAGMTADDDIAIVRTDETRLHEQDSIEVLPIKPLVVGVNLVFEVSHFSVYVVSWLKNVTTAEDRQKLQNKIISVRQKRKPATFFAVVKKDDSDSKGWMHILVAEVVMSSKSARRRRRWREDQCFEEQTPAESRPIMLAPGDEFYVDVKGNVRLEEERGSKCRKLQFSQCRASFQAFRLKLQKGLYDPEMAYGHVIIYKKTDTGLAEVTSLRIQLTPPPKPPPKTSKQSSSGKSKPHVAKDEKIRQMFFEDA